MSVLTYVLLLMGFALLIKGADIFVEGSSSIAKKFGIPDLIIGLTIVALGTSAPEIAVSTLASLDGANEVAISNIIGSNMFNIMLVIGVCALIKPMKVQGSLLRKEFPFSILASVVLLVFMLDVPLSIGTNSVQSIDIISRSEGLVLLAFFGIFLYSVISSTLESKTVISSEELGVDDKVISLPLSLVYIVLGIIAIVFGGDIVVNSAVEIATAFGLSQTLIGLTIVSMGTSLPELVTSIIAARKGSSDMALGNVVGSNIFNIFLTLGISASISPILVLRENIIDTFILTIVSIIILVFAFTKRRVSRVEGAIILALYVLYTYYIIIR